MANTEALDGQGNKKESKMIGSGKWCGKNKAFLFVEVEIHGKRYKVGYHVAVCSDTAQLDICVIKTLYQYLDGDPMFRGNWFWYVDDVRNIEARRKRTSATSKILGTNNEVHELLLVMLLILTMPRLLLKSSPYSLSRSLKKSTRKSKWIAV